MMWKIKLGGKHGNTVSRKEYKKRAVKKAKRLGRRYNRKVKVYNK